MNQILENNFLKVTISDNGAELISIYDKTKETELIWQADPAFWKRHAPILFPNVGKHYQNQYRIHSNSYPSSQHGFARDSVFTCTNHTADSVTHVLYASPETKKIYPFDFQLYVTHELTDKTLTVSWKVCNSGEDTMYFTIGAHPAFRVPVVDGTSYTDYSLSFENQASLSYYLLNPEFGTAITDTTYELSLDHGKCKLDPHMFDKDALIFDHTQIRKVSICLPNGDPYIQMDAEDFPNFGIWSVPGAEFVCLEPWMGRCDDTGFSGELSEKNGINVLRENECFQKSYTITIC